MTRIITRLVCGCPAQYDAIAGECVAECQCCPERQRARWLAQERARFASIDASQKRLDAPLYRVPFSILRGGTL